MAMCPQRILHVQNMEVNEHSGGWYAMRNGTGEYDRSEAMRETYESV